MEKVFIPVPSGTSGLPPGVSPYANPTSANAYKGALRGLFGGVLMGGTLGGLVGLTVSGLIAGGMLAFGAAPITWGVAAAITGGFTMVGMKYYKDLFELTGAVSGGVSAAFEKHDYREHQQFLALHKELDGLRSKNAQMEQGQSLIIRGMARIGLITPQEVQALGVARAHDQTMQQAAAGACPDHGPSCPGHAPLNQDDVVKPVVASTELLQHPITNYRDLPKEANPSKPFVFWDVVGIGALVGAFIGAAFFGAGHLIAEHIPEFLGGSNIPAAVAGVATVLGGAVGGATYGINRHYVRQWFFLTNALYEGDLRLINQQKGQEISNILENCKQRGEADCPILPNEDLAPRHVVRSTTAPDTRVAQMQPQGVLAQQPTLQASV